MSPKICSFGLLIILNCRDLKGADTERGFLWTPCIYQKTDSPEKVPLPQILFPPKEFHQVGRIDPQQKRRQEVDTTPRQTLSQIVTPAIYSSKSHSSSLKANIPAPISLLRWYVSLNSGSHLRELISFPGYLPWIHEAYIWKNFVCFSLINLLWQKPWLRIQKGRGKIIFPPWH